MRSKKCGLLIASGCGTLVYLSSNKKVEQVNVLVESWQRELSTSITKTLEPPPEKNKKETKT